MIVRNDPFPEVLHWFQYTQATSCSWPTWIPSCTISTRAFIEMRKMHGLREIILITVCESRLLCPLVITVSRSICNTVIWLSDKHSQACEANRHIDDRQNLFLSSAVCWFLCLLYHLWVFMHSVCGIYSCTCGFKLFLVPDKSSLNALEPGAL